MESRTLDESMDMRQISRRKEKGGIEECGYLAGEWRHWLGFAEPDYDKE